jgi:hypothetical protein
MAGVARVVNNLPAFVDATQQRAVRGMTQALILGASEASAMTPIDTSNLLNSQYRDVQQDGDKIVGRVGYTADYAAAVHDPDNPQRFRRASAEKEFLKKGFERAEPSIEAVLAGSIRT